VPWMTLVDSDKDLPIWLVGIPVDILVWMPCHVPFATPFGNFHLRLVVGVAGDEEQD